MTRWLLEGIGACLTTLFIPSFRSTVFSPVISLFLSPAARSWHFVRCCCDISLSHPPTTVRQIRIPVVPASLKTTLLHNRIKCLLDALARLVRWSQGDDTLSSRDRQQQFRLRLFDTCRLFGLASSATVVGLLLSRESECFELILTQPSDTDPGKMGGG